LAGRNLDLAAELSATFLPANLGSRRVGRRTLYGHLLQSHLYTALGAPADQLKPIWDQVADSARRAPKASRAQIINFGWAAALGLFLQNPADPTPLDELQALDGVNAPPELRALSAIDKGDSARARELLQQPDSATPSAYHNRPQWWGYRQMIAAHAWHELGDDTRALAALNAFMPDRFGMEGLDVRWLLLGQAR